MLGDESRGDRDDALDYLSEFRVRARRIFSQRPASWARIITMVDISCVASALRSRPSACSELPGLLKAQRCKGESPARFAHFFQQSRTGPNGSSSPTAPRSTGPQPGHILPPGTIEIDPLSNLIAAAGSPKRGKLQREGVQHRMSLQVDGTRTLRAHQQVGPEPDAGPVEPCVGWLGDDARRSSRSPIGLMLHGDTYESPHE